MFMGGQRQEWARLRDDSMEPGLKAREEGEEVEEGERWKRKMGERDKEGGNGGGNAGQKGGGKGVGKTGGTRGREGDESASAVSLWCLM